MLKCKSWNVYLKISVTSNWEEKLVLFYPTWSLKTHMVNNSMQQEGIRHHQALLEKKE
jgi:hypothetical protein